MNPSVVRTTLALLIFAFLGVSFMMISPVEKVEAWLLHECCAEWEVIYIFPIYPEDAPIEIIEKICVDYDYTWHWSPLPHDFTCPSTS